MSIVQVLNLYLPNNISQIIYEYISHEYMRKYWKKFLVSDIYDIYDRIDEQNYHIMKSCIGELLKVGSCSTKRKDITKCINVFLNKYEIKLSVNERERIEDLYLYHRYHWDTDHPYFHVHIIYEMTIDN